MAESEASVFTLARLQMELDRLFREARGAFAEPAPAVGAAWVPALDVCEHGETLRVVVELPEVTAASLTIEVHHGVLTVRGTRTPLAEAGRFLRLERPQGSFERRIDLPRPVDTHQGRARLRAGVLTIEFPRVLERRARPRRVPIEDEP
jgi:HSP20 family protein